jgi:hypothetical protein
MKYLTLLITASLIGAGCLPWQPASEPSTPPVLKAPTAQAVCPAPPIEDESGRLRYPIMDAYKNLPHIGQIYTALDCQMPERIQTIPGMKDGMYVQGVRLRFKPGTLTTQDRTMLGALGFTEEPEDTWRTDKKLSIEQLMELKPLVTNPAVQNTEDFEDCVRCG